MVWFCNDCNERWFLRCLSPGQVFTRDPQGYASHIRSLSRTLAMHRARFGWWLLAITGHQFKMIPKCLLVPSQGPTKAFCSTKDWWMAHRLSTFPMNSMNFVHKLVQSPSPPATLWVQVGSKIWMGTGSGLLILHNCQYVWRGTWW